MTKQHINIGQSANDKAGDPLRTAFSKVNDNFDELYNSVSAVVVVSATAPTSPGQGDLWWNSVSGRMYVYYGSAWVDASPVDGAGISSTNELVNGAHTVSLGTDGTLTLPDSATVAVGDIGVLQGLELAYDTSREQLNAAFAADSYEGDGWPAGPNSYNALLLSTDPAIQPAWIPLAQSVRTAWLALGSALEPIYLDIQVAGYTWNFSNAGDLSVPGNKAIKGFDNLQLNVDGGGGKTAVVEIDGYNSKVLIKTTTPGAGIIDDAWTFGDAGELTLPVGGVIQTLTTPEVGTRLTDIPGWIRADTIAKTAGFWMDTTPQSLKDAMDDTGLVDWRFNPDGTTDYYQVLAAEYVEGNTILELTFDANLPLESAPYSVESPNYSARTSSNISILANENEWTFDADGQLTVPSGLRIGGSNGHAEITNTSPDASLYIVNTGLNQLVVEWTAGNNQLPVGADVKAAGIYAGVNGLNIGLLNAQDVSHSWHFNGDGSLRFPDLTEQTTAWTGITGFGEGFSLTAADKIVTNKLYSTNLTQPTQHYRLELDTNGVVVLPDGSIINGSTIRGVAGTGELNYTGITIGPNINDAEKTWMWVDHANAYITTNNAANTWTFGNDGALALPQGAVISDTASSPGLLKKKYSGTFVLDPTWFAANAGNLVETTVPQNILQSTDLEVFGAFSFEFTGYFVPPTSANYTFRAHADETFVFWIGAKALSGYTYANKDMYGDFNGTFPEQQTQSFTIALTAGQFYPIRIQWGNSAGWGVLDVFTWANDAGQADTENFSGHIYTADTGTAVVSVSDNKSIVLRTANDTTNNWTFSADGTLTLPGDIVDSEGISILVDTPDNRWIVDPSNTATYTANGSVHKPFKTITAALAHLEVLIAAGQLTQFDETANIVLSPQFIVLTSSTTEDVNLTHGHIYIVGDTPDAGHVPIWIQGHVTITPSASTGNAKATNDFGLFHVAVLPTGAYNGITVTGSNPCRVYLEDVYVYQSNSSYSAVLMDNTGTGSKLEMVDCHLSRDNGTTHLLDIVHGYCKIDNLETNGIGPVMHFQNASTGTMLNSVIDSDSGTVITLANSAAFGMGNCILNNTSASSNSHGVTMSGTATMQFGVCTFNVPVGDGSNRAINGTATNIVLYTGPVFQYGSTNKISAVITLIPLTTTFSPV
jgi:hypothetical protein